MITDGKEVPLEGCKNKFMVAREQVMDNMIVPARQEAINTGEIKMEKCTGIRMVYWHLDTTDNCGVVVATSLLDNPTPDPVTVYKGSHLALFSPMDHLDMIKFGKGHQQPNVNHLSSSGHRRKTGAQKEVPTQLNDFLDQGTTNLNHAEAFYASRTADGIQRSVYRPGL